MPSQQYFKYNKKTLSRFLISLFNSSSPIDKVSENYNKVLSKFTKTQTLLSSESSEDDTIKVSLDIIMKDDLDQNNHNMILLQYRDFKSDRD